MNRYILTLLGVVALGLTACDDVPAPYEIDNSLIPNEEEPNSLVIYSEDFNTTIGQCYNVVTEGEYPWIIDRDYLKVTAYVDGANYKADTWLVTPEIDLTQVDSACIYFDYIVRYANNSELGTNYQLNISSDFDGDVTTANWTSLNYDVQSGSDWETWYQCNYVDIPKEFTRKKIVISLRYIADSKAATWEVKNFAVYRGAHSDYTNDAPAVVPIAEAVQLPYKESFETSLGTYTSLLASGKGEWFIDYKTAKASGYDNASKTNTAGVYMLVSSPVEISEAAHITYDYILRYKQKDTYYSLRIIDDLANNDISTWTTLKNNHIEGKDWTNFEHADVNVPAEFVGKTVRIALTFKCTDDNSATWEVKNLEVSAGKGIDEVVLKEDDDENDTPAPTDDSEKGLPYSETFEKSLGSFKSELISGSGKWFIDYKTAKASGYDNASKTYTAGKYLLVSAPVKITEAAHITYEYILRYVDKQEYTSLLISEDYVDDAAAATWVVLNATHTEGKNWDTFANADVNVPAQYVGKTVRIALSFNSGADKSATWEVKNFKIEAGGNGENTTPQTPQTPQTPTGNILYSFDFTAGLGEWKEQTEPALTNIAAVWTRDPNHGAKADAYKEKANVIDSRLVSPVIDLTNAQSATLTFTHKQQYFTAVEDMQRDLTLQVSEDGQAWTTVQFAAYPEPSNKVTTAEATADLSAFAGKKIYIAFRTTNKDNAWYISNLSIK